MARPQALLDDAVRPEVPPAEDRPGDDRSMSTPATLAWLYRSEAFAEDLESSDPAESATERFARTHSGALLWGIAVPALALVLGLSAWVGLH